ncbi:peptidoglycan DD-metalloendopeptidase family protein [Thalassotalea fusca]
MLDHSIINQLLMPLCMLIGWSGILYIAARFVEQCVPKVANWSRFWQLLFIAAFVPLLPGYTLNSSHTILKFVPDWAGEYSGQPLSTVDFSLLEVSSTVEILSILSVSILAITIGSLYFVGQFFARLCKVVMLIKQSTRFKDFSGLTEHQAQCISTYNIRVYVSKNRISPFVFGLFNTYLVLPQSFFELSERQQMLLLEHELNHVRRRDPQAVLIMQMLASIFWFNPFLRFVERRYTQVMELECDKQVIVGHPTQKLAYAQTLIASLKKWHACEQASLVSHFTDQKLTKAFFEQRIKRTMTTAPASFLHYRQKWLLLFISLMLIPLSVLAKPFVSIELVSVDNEKWQVPVINARLSSDFGHINAFRSKHPHKGMDFAASIGTLIRASAAGKVIIADNSSLHRNYGKVIVIEHSNGLQSLYAHMDSYDVSVGDYVLAGQMIGKVGETGRVTGPHLHFEVIRQGERIDPKTLIGIIDVAGEYD